MKGCYKVSLKALLLFAVLALLSPVFASPAQASATAPIAINASQGTASSTTKPVSTPAIKKPSKYVSERKIARKSKAQKPQAANNKIESKKANAKNKIASAKKITTNAKTHRHTIIKTASKTQVSKSKVLASTNSKKTNLTTLPHHYHHTLAARHPVITSHHQTALALKQNTFNSNDEIDADNDVVTRLQQGNNSEDFAPNNFNETLHTRILQDRYAAGQTAKAQIGTPYQWGAEAPGDGFDCSGLSQFVYQQEGITIPRTAAEQYRSLIPVSHPQEGDLVFFRTHPHSNAISHVGIYIGDGYFVDSPRTGEAVRVDRLDNPYWEKAYAGARRVLTPRKVETAQLTKVSLKPTPPEQVAQVQTAAAVTPTTINSTPVITSVPQASTLDNNSAT